ncbi:ABC transporter permease [Halanaerobium sp. Z-7514]|uniref:ABC transporter permease n=1 Tax=Halanaerobium polyolivorans TaxID=2886943 RepID=A0AAW4X1Z2_9FIRM|nr:ABC transporter permease [Halanaerobium polyolivorans]MCC3145825.1 ABC transporter permease [Halanaerobium polyolivorans]RQD76605.1 MAG: ABC transporter permease [Halanaerobium sp. MSAO_Bac5]
MSNGKTGKINKEKILGIIKNQGILIFFALLLFSVSLVSDRFLSARNIILVLRQVSITGVMACGITFLLISGNFDLSIGSLLSLTTVVVINLHDKIGPVPAIIITLGVGILIGIINGTLVGYIKLNSMIVTLGMLTVLQAVTLIYTGGTYSAISRPDEAWFRFFGRGYILRIPTPVIIFGGLVILFHIILNKTVYGKYLFALGGNRTASEYTGINESFITFITFIVTGLTTALAGIMMGSRLMAAQNYIGEGYEFTVLTAVVLGGTSLFGGSGSVIKTLIGVLILGFLTNAFIIMGFPYYVQWIVQWGIIIGAVWMDVASKRGKLWA